MRFAVDKEKFLAGLQKVQGIVPEKSTIPILSNLLLRTAEGGIEIIATDLEVGIKVFVEATIVEKGNIAVNAKLYEVAKNTSAEDCFYSTKYSTKGHLIIKSDKAKFDMVGITGEDYPLLPLYPDEFSFVDTQTLVDMLRKTSFSVSTDDIRYSINGLYIERDGDATIFVATDGHRLSVAKEAVAIPLNFLKEGEGIILPKKGVYEVIRLLSREKSLSVGVGLAQNSNSIVFFTDDTALTIRLIEGKFVNYKEVIPKEHDKPIRVNRMKLLSALRRVSILSESETVRGRVIKKVKLNLSHNNILISGKAEIGEAEEDVEIEYGKEDMEIVCNARYLIEPLSVIEDEEVMLEFKDSRSAIVIKPCNNERYLYVIMPMRSK